MILIISLLYDYFYNLKKSSVGKKTLFRGGLIYYNLNERLQAQLIHIAVVLQ